MSHDTPHEATERSPTARKTAEEREREALERDMAKFPPLSEVDPEQRERLALLWSLP